MPQPPAAAHGGGGGLGFRSKVVRITPAATGLSVAVIDYDDRLRLRNETGEPLVILGYEGEPYLAFRNGFVYRNSRSPATYLNDDRFAKVVLPARANAKAPPDWEEVGQSEEYDWHDHRIHWMSKVLPPRVQDAENEPHHVFDWVVPARLGDAPLRISGSLDYEPPPSGNPMVLVVAGFLVGIGGGVAIWLRRRREGNVLVKAAHPPSVRTSSAQRNTSTPVRMLSIDERCELLCLDLEVAEAIRHRLRPHAAAGAAKRAQALSDPTRLTLAAALAESDELCVCDLAWIGGRPQNLVSHHLKVLRFAGLARSRREGKMVMYRLTDVGRSALEALLLAEELDRA